MAARKPTPKRNSADKPPARADFLQLRVEVAALHEKLDSQSISDSDKLAFLKDYLLRLRQDTMQDKAVLTQIVYLKVIVFAALFSLLRSPTATIGLVLLPIVLFSLDYLHRTRFNEIFDRWYFASTTLVPRIRALYGEQFEFFETIVAARALRGDYARAEGAVRAVMTALAVIGTIPIAGAYLSRALDLSDGHGALVSVAWSGFLLVVYGLLFGVSPRYRSTHIHIAFLPTLLGALACVLLTHGAIIIEWYGTILALSQGPQ